ncbi:MAG TPA: hypothetical protein VIF02_13395 [Methylocella sp.]|jgi:hypothetical protein
MTVVAVLKDLADNVVRLALKGDNLALKAAVRPPLELIERLREHKAEVVALLGQEAGSEQPSLSSGCEPPLSPSPTVAFAEDARVTVERLLDAMAAENERRRDWWREPLEGRLAIRSIDTSETTVIYLANTRGRA